MAEQYEVLLDSKVGSALARSPTSVAREKLRNIVRKMGDRLAEVLTGDNVIRIPDQAILDRNDPNLAFYQLRDKDVEVGFYVDRPRKRVFITSLRWF
jgi:hypothetical protein